MANTAATLPGTGSSESTGVAWTGPTDIQTDGGGAAYRSGTGVSAQLTGVNYGFTIPTSATIKGIVLDIRKYDTYASTTATDNTVKLKKSGGIVGDNKAYGTTWPTSWTVFSYGGATDLWGTTWTPAEVNHSGFGALLTANKPDNSGDHYVDYFKITVYYTLPGGVLFYQQI